MNVVAGVNVIFKASRTPLQSDARGVTFQSNVMDGDLIMGCSLAGVTCSSNTD
jgi:hypothetical protein